MDWLAGDRSYADVARDYRVSPSTLEKYLKGGTPQAREWLRSVGMQRVAENVQRRANAKPSKLTADDVAVIKDLLANTTIAVRIIAKMFEVRPATIYAIKNGQNWAWVTNDRE